MIDLDLLPKKIFLVLLVLIFFCIGYENSYSIEPKDNENQILISKMKAAVDSVLKAAADSMLNNTKVPGLVALVFDRNKGIEWIYEAGYSNIPEKLPMNRDYTFRIGSNTKTIVVTVLLQLVDEGKVSLYDKLSKYFPEYPKADKVTVEMLANMTSGIFNYTNDEEFWNEMMANPTKVLTPDELIEIGLFKHGYNFEPGEKFEYSNTNTIIIGKIIEKVTGNSLENEINNRIIQLLQLTKTGFLTSGLDFPGPHPRGYYAGEYEPDFDVTTLCDISWAWAAGSAYSTPFELQKYVQTLVGGGFISDSLQQKRLNDVRMINDISGYGIGILKRGSFYGHNGGLPGFTSSMYHSNLRNTTIIIYFNSQLPEIPDVLFLRIVEILYGKDF